MFFFFRFLQILGHSPPRVNDNEHRHHKHPIKQAILLLVIEIKVMQSAAVLPVQASKNLTDDTHKTRAVTCVSLFGQAASALTKAFTSAFCEITLRILFSL